MIISMRPHATREEIDHVRERIPRSGGGNPARLGEARVSLPERRLRDRVAKPVVREPIEQPRQRGEQEARRRRFRAR